MYIDPLRYLIQVALETALEITLTLKLRIRPLIIEASYLPLEVFTLQGAAHRGPPYRKQPIGSSP